MITLSPSMPRELHRKKSLPTHLWDLTHRIECLRTSLHTLEHPSGFDPMHFSEYRVVVWDLQQAEALLQKRSSSPPEITRHIDRAAFHLSRAATPASWTPTLQALEKRSAQISEDLRLHLSDHFAGIRSKAFLNLFQPFREITLRLQRAKALLSQKTPLAYQQAFLLLREAEDFLTTTPTPWTLTLEALADYLPAARKRLNDEAGKRGHYEFTGDNPLGYHEYFEANQELQRVEETLRSDDPTVPTQACIAAERALTLAAKKLIWTPID